MSDRYRMAAWRTPELTGNLRLALLYLAELADEDGLSSPDYAEIAQATGCSLRTVPRLIDRLEARGLVAVTRRRGRGRSHHYRLLLHPVSQLPASSSPQNMPPTPEPPAVTVFGIVQNMPPDAKGDSARRAPAPQNMPLATKGDTTATHSAPENMPPGAKGDTSCDTTPPENVTPSARPATSGTFASHAPKRRSYSSSKKEEKHFSNPPSCRSSDPPHQNRRPARGTSQSGAPSTPEPAASTAPPRTELANELQARGIYRSLAQKIVARADAERVSDQILLALADQWLDETGGNVRIVQWRLRNNPLVLPAPVAGNDVRARFRAALQVAS